MADIVTPEENLKATTATPEADGEKSKIDYEKYRALLDEKKKTQAERDELASKMRVIEESKLAEEKRYKELFETREKELADLRAGVEKERANAVNSKKLQAFSSATGIRDSFFSLVDLDKLIVESDGSINKASLEDYVAQFKKAYPELIASAKKGLPEKAPQSTEVSTKGMKSSDILNKLKGK
jgi:hypothetical protein